MSALALFVGFLVAGICLVPFFNGRLRSIRWVGYLLEVPAFVAVIYAAGASWPAAVVLGVSGSFLAMGGIEIGLRASESDRRKAPPSSRGRGW